MGKFNKGEKFGGKKRFDGDRGGFRKGERSERPAMHDAVCSDCGRNCQVPFRPTGDKPVFCSDCFSKKENPGGGRFERRDSGRSGFGSKQMFSAVCDKCHRDCEVPFRPTGDKPVFCSDCFGRSEKGAPSGASHTPDQHRQQFEVLNGKLDKILKILAPEISTGKTFKEEKTLIMAAKKMPEKKSKNKKIAAPKKTKKAGKKSAAKKKR